MLTLKVPIFSVCRSAIVMENHNILGAGKRFEVKRIYFDIGLY